VYRYIFINIVPFLYRSCTIQQNRLTLTYQDESKYKTFEAMSEKEFNYRKKLSHVVHISCYLEAFQGAHITIAA